MYSRSKYYFTMMSYNILRSLIIHDNSFFLMNNKTLENKNKPTVFMCFSVHTLHRHCILAFNKSLMTLLGVL